MPPLLALHYAVKLFTFVSLCEGDLFTQWKDLPVGWIIFPRQSIKDKAVKRVLPIIINPGIHSCNVRWACEFIEKVWLTTLSPTLGLEKYSRSLQGLQVPLMVWSCEHLCQHSLHSGIPLPSHALFNYIVAKHATTASQGITWNMEFSHILMHPPPESLKQDCLAGLDTNSPGSKVNSVVLIQVLSLRLAHGTTFWGSGTQEIS